MRVMLLAPIETLKALRGPGYLDSRRVEWRLEHQHLVLGGNFDVTCSLGDSKSAMLP